jgi:uncharacterized repeat protein (TIGR03943 family)
VTVDARRARAATLAIWAIVFGTLWVTGSSDHYLGPRTQWVVPFGALALGLATLAYGAAMRDSAGRTPLSRREAGALAVFIAPVIAILFFPHAELGSFAASRKASGSVFLSAKPPVPKSPKDVTFLDLRIAEGDPEFALEGGIRNGIRVQLLGLVTSKNAGESGFELSRFYISCCIADAVAVGVPVEATEKAEGRRIRTDDWLSVTGIVAKRGKHFILEADEIRPADKPAHPDESFLTG